MLLGRQHEDLQAGGDRADRRGQRIAAVQSLWVVDDQQLEAIGRRNAEKAKVLYDTLDSSGGFYRPHAKPGSRSNMNVTFRLPSEDLEKQLLGEAGKLGMSGLKGHRSVGGIRASIYNAFPPAGVEALVGFLQDFAAKNG